MAEAGKRREPERPEPDRTAAERLERARKRLARRDKKIEELQAKLAAVSGDGAEIAGIRPENVVWIFCTGRSGSTWLSHMMGDVEKHARWNEPYVGALFGEFYYERYAHKRSKGSILGDPLRDLWLGQIRQFVLQGAQARYPDLGPGGYVVVKEPHGSIGAPLMMEALPESRMILLVRDPRDVVSSALDGQRQGSWTSKHKRWQDSNKPKTRADTDPDAFVKMRAETYLRDIGKAKEAYDLHSGLKVLIRYEELRAETLSTMRHLYATLGIPADEDELARVVEEHAWENIPEDKKGSGMFYRKATPGSWDEDLTPEQVRIVEDVARPLLETFYIDT